MFRGREVKRPPSGGTAILDALAEELVRSAWSSPPMAEGRNRNDEDGPVEGGPSGPHRRRRRRGPNGPPGGAWPPPRTVLGLRDRAAIARQPDAEVCAAGGGARVGACRTPTRGEAMRGHRAARSAS